MKPIVNHRLTLATSFVRQHEQLVQREISARYAFEMGTRLDPRNRDMLDKARQQLTVAELETLKMEQMVEAITGMTLQELNAAQIELEVVLTRQIEVENEVVKIKALLPVLAGVVEKFPDAPGADDSRKQIADRTGELAIMEEHNARLTELAEQLAEKIQYRDISDVTVVQPTLVVAQR